MHQNCIEFKRFKTEVLVKNDRTKNYTELSTIKKSTSPNQIQYSHQSPQRQPKSFRELSGSRQKNGILSRKKKVLENKLNTLRSNQKNENYNNANDERKITIENIDFDKKEGLFKKLLTSRSPNSVAKNFQNTSNISSSNGTNDSTISFSAFKVGNFDK